MKKLFFSAALVAASFFGFAQDDAKALTFSAGVDAALPFGDFGKVYSFGVGGSVQGKYNLDETLGLTLNLGYLSYQPKKEFKDLGIKSSGAVPVLAGIEYNFSENIFASGQLGMSFFTEKGGGSAFTYAPGVGFRFAESFSALVKYQGMSKNGESISQVGVRLAYSF